MQPQFRRIKCVPNASEDLRRARESDKIRNERRRAIKAEIQSRGDPHELAALKCAELGHGWQAVALASWGKLTDEQAQALTGYRP